MGFLWLLLQTALYLVQHKKHVQKKDLFMNTTKHSTESTICVFYFTTNTKSQRICVKKVKEKTLLK